MSFQRFVIAPCLGALFVGLILLCGPLHTLAQTPSKQEKPSKTGTAKAARAPAKAASAAAAAENASNKPGFNYTLGPTPSWVVPAQFTGSPAVEPAPMHYRFIDEQVRVEGKSMTEYVHVMRVVDQTAGLPVASQIELEFDPSYQSLTLHTLDVLRQGVRINKLDRNRMQLLQREKQLEQRMYDGRATLSVVLDDVRVGDEIDLAYSTTGLNPVFGGKFVHQMWLSSHRGPVAQYQIRLLAPADRPIAVLLGPRDVTTQNKPLGAMQETTWRRTSVPPLRSEPGAPASAWMPEQISFSEFANWAAVAAWGEALFSATSAGPRVAQKVADIQSAFTTPEAQVREALRFVQQEVRYFGVEIGTSTHQPAAPDLVMDRRFGDCKDKVNLLNALLRGLGISSRPVLVSTRLRADVGQVQVSPLAFDHVIARVELAGQSYLLDATRAHQRGPLASRQSVGLAKGLDLVAGTTALSTLPSANDVLRLAIDDQITVKQFSEPPRLLSRVTYRNDLAESVNESLATHGVTALSDALSAAYVRAYPKLRRMAPAQVERSDADDAVTIVQEFEVPEFWRYPEQRVLVAEVVQWAAAEWLLPPKTENRRYALAFPTTGLFKHQVRVEFPEDVWNQPASQRSDEGDAHFNIRTSTEATRRSADFSAEVRILADRVEPAQWQAFSAQVNKLLPRLASQVAVPALPQAHMQRLTNDSKTLEEAMRSKRIKALTPLQVQSRYRVLLLQAQIDGGRLSAQHKSQALVARGVALDQVGQQEDAQKDFEAALALQPESVEALNGASANALGRGDTAQAITRAAQVLKLRPSDSAALNTRAIAQLFAGQWPQARADWQASLIDRGAQRRGYPLLWLALGTRRAGEDLGALLQTYPRENWPTEWPRPLLDAAFGQATPESALQAAKSSKTPLESQTEAYFYLGEKLYAEGDVARAREQWRKAVDLGVVEFLEHGAARQRLLATR